MKQNTQLVFLVVIIVQTETYRPNRGVHYQACSTRKINFSQFILEDRLLLSSLPNGLKWFKKVALKPKIKVFAQAENVAPPPCHKIEASEVGQKQGAGILNGVKSRRIDQGAGKIRKEWLVG